MLSGCRGQLSAQAVTLGPDSGGAHRLSDSAVRLSDTCYQAVGESAVSAVKLSGTVRAGGVCCQTVYQAERAQNHKKKDPTASHCRCAPRASPRSHAPLRSSLGRFLFGKDSDARCAALLTSFFSGVVYHQKHGQRNRSLYESLVRDHDHHELPQPRPPWLWLPPFKFGDSHSWGSGRCLPHV